MVIETIGVYPEPESVALLASDHNIDFTLTLGRPLHSPNILKPYKHGTYPRALWYSLVHAQ